MSTNFELAVLDFETDPFLWGREPRPFAAGLYTADNYVEFWGDDCVDKMYQYLCRLETPLRIYAHNGGKFDFLYFVQQEMLDSDVFIINGRITKARIDKHELRDSYAILPIPLSAYSKDSINYDWFERDQRERHKKQILQYLYTDCVYLYDLVQKFIDRFGLKLTIGSTAIKKLREFHPFETQGQANDERIRPYYFGGRVQCFETGIIKTAVKVYDVNSMYPKVMRDYWHPCGGSYEWFHSRDLNEAGDFKLGKRRGWPFFIRFTGKNYGALPVRVLNSAGTPIKLDFTVEHGEFCTTSHEFQTALKYGLIEVEKVHEIMKPRERIKFDEYVDTYIKEKIRCKKEGDKAGTIFAKLLLNSAYGKTAQNPAAYFDYRILYTPEQKQAVILENELLEPEKHWRLYELYYNEDSNTAIEVWKKPATKPVYYDVAIGASITSAARSILLEALHKAQRPLYCDTDSIVCESVSGVTLDPYELGAWDLEACGDKIGIAGKKMYCVMDGKQCVKKATKGANLESAQILRLCEGVKIHDFRDAPTFSRAGAANFIHRRIKATVNA